MKMLFSCILLLLASGVAAAESSLEFVGVTASGDRRLFVIQDTRAGVVSDFLPVGASFRGFRIEGYDAKQEVLSLSSGATSLKLPLKDSRVRDGVSPTSDISQVVAISGAVKKGGKVGLHVGASLRRAVEAAGGFSDNADRKRVRVTRREKDGSLKSFGVDCAAGKADDFKVAAGDIVYVPVITR